MTWSRRERLPQLNLTASVDPPPPDLAEIGRMLDKVTFEIGWIITHEAIREAVEATLKDEGTLGDIKVLSSPYAPKDQVLLLARSSLLDEMMLAREEHDR